jgi:hypothetical protein
MSNEVTLVPDVSEPECGMTLTDMIRNTFSSQGVQGGLLEGYPNIETFLQNLAANDPKKRILEEFQKKYRGDNAEADTTLAILDATAGLEVLVMLGHKTSLSLVEDRIRRELDKKNLTADQHEGELVDNLYSFIGVTPDKTRLQAEAKMDSRGYFHGLGRQTVAFIETTIVSENAKTGGSKIVKQERRQAMDALQKGVDRSKVSQPASLDLDPTRQFFLGRMRKEFNKHKREHDLTVVKPHHKAVLQMEVKAVTSDKNHREKVVMSAIKQL